MKDVRLAQGWPSVGSAADDQLFGEATEAWNSGKPELILPKLERALQRSRDYRLWHIHGLILRELERREDALPSLQRAVELNPKAANPAKALAQTLYEAGMPSLEAYAQALRLAPGDEELVAGLAMALVASGEMATAVAGMERSLALSPLWTRGHIMLSKLRWIEGERNGFTRSFEAARRAHPRSPELWVEQLLALVHAEQWDEALRVISEGRAAVGNQLMFALNEAVIRSTLGQTASAELLFDSLQEVDDQTVQVHRVRHYLTSGRVEQAAAIIEQWLPRPEGLLFYPYASIAWRQLNPARWEWLEGDERFVGVYDIAERLPPLDQLADALRGIHKLSGQPVDQSLRGGSQTDGDIFMRVDPILIELREAIRRTVAEHVAQLPRPDPNHPLLAPRRDQIKFSGAWSVRLREAGFHANHVHWTEWISSALYVSLPPDLGVGDAGCLTLGEAKSTSFNCDLAPFRTIEPKPGRLVLFPSYMWHGTRPFGQGERLTVAFDVSRRQ